MRRRTPGFTAAVTAFVAIEIVDSRFRDYRGTPLLDRIADWDWQDGLLPGPAAPVWPMDAFRDRFLDAFSGTAGTASLRQPR